MRHFLLTTAATLVLGGTALAQNSTPPNQQPDAKAAPAGQAAPAEGSAAQPATGEQSAQGGLRSVDPSAQVRLTFYTVQAVDMRASKLLGTEVYNLNNDNIGEVEDHKSFRLSAIRM